MKTLQHLLFSIVVFSFLNSNLFGQQDEQLTLELIHSGQLREETFGDIQWMKYRSGFTKTNPAPVGTELIFYSIQKGEWEHGKFVRWL